MFINDRKGQKHFRDSRTSRGPWHCLSFDTLSVTFIDLGVDIRLLALVTG